MALNKTTMKTNIKNSILANVPGANDNNGAVTALSAAIVDGIIDHLISNGVVTIPAGTVSQGASPSVVVNPAPITNLTIS